FGIVRKQPGPCSPEFAGFDNSLKCAGLVRRRDESAVSAALDGFQSRISFLADNDTPIPRKGFTFRLGAEIVTREEVSNVFRTKGHHARPASVCPTQKNARQSSARMAVSNFPAWRFNLLIRNKAHPPQSRFLMQGQGKVIDPLKKIRAGLVKHALGKL